MGRASIRVDVSERLGRVDPSIYGHFIEHLGRCINGGIWGEMLRAPVPAACVTRLRLPPHSVVVLVVALAPG